MFPENVVVINMDDIHDIFCIVLLQILQNFKFHTCLIVVLLFILNNFNCDFFLVFVINASQGSAKRAFSEEFYNLVPVCNMIPYYNLIVALFIIISEVVIKFTFVKILATAVIA